jgi:hypothetical protein
MPYGADIQPLFLANIAPYARWITPRRGSILNERWAGGPVEILLIDAANSPPIMWHIANEFLPHLEVGGILIQQDRWFDDVPQRTIWSTGRSSRSVTSADAGSMRLSRASR